MTLIRAFTGPTRLTEDQVEWIEEEINGLIDEPDEVRTGCAPGLDTIAAHLQWAEFPRAKHRLFVPSAYHNEKIVAYLGGRDEDVHVIRCPRKTQRAEAYRTRNEWMIRGVHDPMQDLLLPPAHELEAFVFKPEFYRSGEWMSINIAIKSGVLVNKHVIPEA
jgi:hypothetical protein